MLRTILAAVLSLSLSASLAHAEESSVAAQMPSAPIRTSLTHVRFGSPDHALPAPWQRASRPNGKAQKITAGFALGVLGMLGGAVIGGSLDRHCGCDDPGLAGAIIGAPIGAIAGAIVGFRLASR